MMPETRAAYYRRKANGFEKFINGEGIDIGSGTGGLTKNCTRYDLREEVNPDVVGDAQYMAELDDHSFDWVYSSHCLEHMEEPRIALNNWWRLVRPGGYMIVSVPHRDYYELKDQVPSERNRRHKWFFLPFMDIEPGVLSLHRLLIELPRSYLLRLDTCCGHYGDHGRWAGERSIEGILQKGVYTPMWELSEATNVIG